MAKSKEKNTVLLGYEDERISDKHKSIIGYWCNKVGGHPDWPFEGIPIPSCKLCGLLQPLVAQIYAPLDNSLFHRTLYIFTCINPNCWNHNDSWTCIRSQLLDKNESVTAEGVELNMCADWCDEANNWNDANGNYDNGNATENINQSSSMSDCESDDDSGSLSAMIDKINVDECNANLECSEKGSGAVGRQSLPTATAEIEREESEVIYIDTPTVPQNDLWALLQESAPVPYYLKGSEKNKNDSMAFVPFLLSVGEEGVSSSNNSEHVRELLQEYQRNHGDLPENYCHNPDRDKKRNSNLEEYEKALPAHGDKMFHQFLNKIQRNPGQILRYSREAESPLLLYRLSDCPIKCSHCNGETVFELQLLPTLIPKLRFPGEDEIRVEFGTVLIFTCKKSCWDNDAKFREEKVIVQMEKI